MGIYLQQYLRKKEIKIGKNKTIQANHISDYKNPTEYGIIRTNTNFQRANQRTKKQTLQALYKKHYEM